MQARIPPALGCLHNFIRIHDPGELDDFSYEEDCERGCRDSAESRRGIAIGPAPAAEVRRANQRRDVIAEEMWVDYQRILHKRGLL
jgi:hypothetical protein